MGKSHQIPDGAAEVTHGSIRPPGGDAKLNV